MSRNYMVINYIRGKMQGFDERFMNCVVKAFNRMYDNKEPNGCMSTSTQLLLCAKYYGYNAKLCYGLCKNGTFEFYHAWLEIDNKIFDIAIYGNTNFTQFYNGRKLELPVINEGYDAACITYGKFVFDKDWTNALIRAAEHQTIESYFDKSPKHVLWQFTCTLLDISPTADNVEKLRSIAKNVIIEAE